MNSIQQESGNRILASLCYFSVFFASFIFPLIVWLISKNPFEKTHAKKALISHLIVFIPLIFILIPFIIFMFGQNDSTMSAMLIIMFLLFGVYVIASLITIIWNIIQGIKVLNV